METDFKEKMAGKDEESLLSYLVNAEKYTSEAVGAAIAELQARGYDFPNDELETAKAKLRQKTTVEISEQTPELALSANGDLVDWDRPVYYSKNAILGFSVIISVLFGAIMLAMNLYKKERKAAWIVIGFGVASVILIYTIGSYVNFRLSGTFFNGLGGYILNEVFWAKYIGKNTRYTARPIWAPLIVAAALVVLFAILLFGFPGV